MRPDILAIARRVVRRARDRGEDALVCGVARAIEIEADCIGDLLRFLNGNRCKVCGAHWRMIEGADESEREPQP